MLLTSSPTVGFSCTLPYLGRPHTHLLLALRVMLCGGLSAVGVNTRFLIHRSHPRCWNTQQCQVICGCTSVSTMGELTLPAYPQGLPLIFQYLHSNSAFACTVEEAQVLACFRKKYVSVRKVELRRRAHGPIHDSATATATPAATSTTTATATTTPTTTTNSNSTDSTTWYVQVEFGGPIRIKGPAKRMCSLLSGAYVVAREVHLARGRRRRGATRANGISEDITDEPAADAAGKIRLEAYRTRGAMQNFRGRKAVCYGGGNTDKGYQHYGLSPTITMFYHTPDN